MIMSFIEKNLHRYKSLKNNIVFLFYRFKIIWLQSVFDFLIVYILLDCLGA